MPKIINFKGKKIVEPGVYAQIKSGIPAVPTTSVFGDVMIIDTGSGKGYGGGSGVSGKYANGKNSLYTFQDKDDFKDFVAGGLWYDLADYIFNPINGASGPSNVSIIRAAETVPAKGSMTFENSEISFYTKNEGSVGNGELNTTPSVGVIRPDFAGVNINDVWAITIGTEDYSIQVEDDSNIIPMLMQMVNEINETTQSTNIYAEIRGLGVAVFCKTGNLALSSHVSSDVNLLPTSDTDTAGFLQGNTLIKGYGWQLKISDTNPSAYVIEFFQGTYPGKTLAGNDINGTIQENMPIRVVTSEEFTNAHELVNWMKNDYNFNKIFTAGKNEEIDIIGNGEITSTDLSNYTDISLLSGGSENYSGTDLDLVLENIRETENTYFLSDKWGKDAKSIENQKILEHIRQDAEFDKFLIIGGGDDESEFEDSPTSSIETAKHYNSVSVILVHSGEMRMLNNSIEEELPSIYHAANVVGRLGGLEPQEPPTFKAISIKNFRHTLGIKQREKALKYGVLHNRTVSGIGNVINQGINTIQKNTQLINPDGTSPEISIMGIGSQLNKELVLNMRPIFTGKNWGTASPADIKSFVEGYLLSRTVLNGNDNLILDFKNVTVKLIDNDYYEIKYGYTPNGPVNRLFITGFMLSANLSS